MSTGTAWVNVRTTGQSERSVGRTRPAGNYIDWFSRGADMPFHHAVSLCSRILWNSEWSDVLGFKESFPGQLENFRRWAEKRFSGYAYPKSDFVVKSPEHRKKIQTLREDPAYYARKMTDVALIPVLRELFRQQGYEDAVWYMVSDNDDGGGARLVVDLHTNPSGCLESPLAIDFAPVWQASGMRKNEGISAAYCFELEWVRRFQSKNPEFKRSKIQTVPRAVFFMAPSVFQSYFEWFMQSAVKGRIPSDSDSLTKFRELTENVLTPSPSLEAVMESVRERIHSSIPAEGARQELSNLFDLPVESTKTEGVSHRIRSPREQADALFHFNK